MLGISMQTSRKTNVSRLLRVAAVVAAMSLITACSSAVNDTGTETADGNGTEPVSASPLDNLVENGVTLTYIVDPPNVYEADDGSITGASAEAIKAILAKLDITNLSYQNVPFDTTIPTLTSGRAELTSFIFNIKPDRCSEVAFANPVYIDRDGAMVQKGNPKNISSYDDLVADESIKIASIRGDAHLDWFKAYNIADSRVQQFDGLPQAIDAVVTGRADVYINGMVNLAGGLLQGGDDVEIAAPFDGPIIDGEEMVSIGSFATSYDNIDLLNAINAVIADMINSGELGEIMGPLGYPASGVPDPTMTAKAICPDAPWPANYIDLAG